MSFPAIVHFPYLCTDCSHRGCAGTPPCLCGLFLWTRKTRSFVPRLGSSKLWLETALSCRTIGLRARSHRDRFQHTVISRKRASHPACAMDTSLSARSSFVIRSGQVFRFAARKKKCIRGQPSDVALQLNREPVALFPAPVGNSCEFPRSPDLHEVYRGFQQVPGRPLAEWPRSISL
jgi:hypothetical protein